MIDDDTNLIDPRRSAWLRDVGSRDYIAATAINHDGTAHFVLARRDLLGDDDALYDSHCEHAQHEQLGQLPLEYVRRLAISSRQAMSADPTRDSRPRKESG